LDHFVNIPSGESKVHIEVLSVLWGNRLSIPDGSLPLSRLLDHGRLAYRCGSRLKGGEMQDVVLFYNGLDIPTRQILDSRGAIPSKIAADAKIAIQEMAEYSQK
ncbi:hypothetical protein Tco_1432474, partial [Tanacetum coccineum]